MIRMRRILFSLSLLLLLPAWSLAQDNADTPPPPENPPIPSPQEPVAPQAMAPPSKSPVPVPAQGVQPVSPGSTVTTDTPATVRHTVTLPARTLVIEQAMPRVSLKTDEIPLPVQSYRPEPAQAPQAPQPSTVQSVAFVREKSRFCRALGALGTRMSGLGQPNVSMGMAEVTQAPVVRTVRPVPTRKTYVVQDEAPIMVQQAPAPPKATPQSVQASPQGASGYQMISVGRRRWWDGWWR
jgi:hypothetical protein